MRKITVELTGAGEERRDERRSGGAAVALLAFAVVVAAAWKSKPAETPVVHTVTQIVTVHDTPPTQTTPTTTTIAPAVVPATLVVDQTELRFTDSVARLVTLRNSGDEPLTIAPPAEWNGSFRTTTNCGAPLAKHESCVVGVSFDANVAGSSKGVLRITSNGGNATIRLVGEAPPPPTNELQPIDFGKQQLRTPGETRSTRFTNGTRAAVFVRAARTSAPFNVTQDGCAGARLTPGSGCDVMLDFDPTVPGLQKGDLRIDSMSDTVLAHASLTGYAYERPPSSRLVFNPPASTCCRTRRCSAS